MKSLEFKFNEDKPEIDNLIRRSNSFEEEKT